MLLTRNINARVRLNTMGISSSALARTMMMSGQMVLKMLNSAQTSGRPSNLGRYAIHYHTPNEKMFKYDLTASNDPRMQGADQRLSRVEESRSTNQTTVRLRCMVVID